MPGVVVTFDPHGRPGVAARFRRQLDAARLHPWYRMDRWLDPTGRAALGRADLGTIDHGPQPLLTDDGRFALAFQGELADVGEKLAALAARGVPTTGGGGADLLLATFRADGEAGVAKLNGSYFFALWDAHAGRLLVGGDRYASRPHMYAFVGDRLVLAPEAAGVVAGLGRTPAPDWRGLGTLMALEYPLGDRTLLEDVRVFPGGTFLAVDAAGARWTEYWRPRYEASAPRSVDAWVEEAAPLYRQAVKRATTGAYCIAVSGGTDSRTIIACAGGAAYPTYTFGQPGSEDVRFAQQVAAARGGAPAVLQLRDDYLHHHAEAMLRLGEGMVSLFHAHDADGIEDVAAMAPTTLYGMTSEYARTEFAENVLAASAGSRPGRLALLARHVRDGRRPLDEVAGDAALVARLAARTWTALDAATAARVLQPGAFAAMRAAVHDGLAEAVARAEGPTAVDRLMAFNVTQRQRRFTSWGIKIAGTAHEYRKPLDDYDLVDFLLRVPPEVRRQLQARVIAKVAPDLAAIPRTGSGAPMDASFATRAIAFGRKRLAQSLRPGRTQSFADPQHLLRTTSRWYYETLLLDPDTLANGLFRPEGVRALLEDHMAGRADAAPAICALATVELWRRRVLGGGKIEAPPASVVEGLAA